MIDLKPQWVHDLESALLIAIAVLSLMTLLALLTIPRGY